ncbi:MAG: hypothetical protein MJ158_00880 [Alphaproteobacteria bacterium]|nr:hypothetical protein [Alphaproteobacteria bacterium]
MKIYSTNVRYFIPGNIHCIVSNNGSVKISSFDKIFKRQIVFNLSKQTVR